MSATAVQGLTRQIAIGARCDTGRVRPGNEDRYCALLPPNTLPGAGGVLAVADGVGGHQAGEVASQMAVDTINRLLGNSGAARESRVGLLQEVISTINGKIYEAGERQIGAGMATTLSIAVIEGQTLSIGHVGDSRVYLYRDRKLEQLTPDHSWVAEEVARGGMTAEEAARDPRRNVITRAVGTAPEVEPALLTAELLPGDSLLLCTDGLHGLVAEERIAAVLGAKPPDEAAEVLVDMANTAGGTDNITVIVAKILTTEPLSQALWERGALTETVVPGPAPKRSLARIAALAVIAPWLAIRWLSGSLRIQRR